MNKWSSYQLKIFEHIKSSKNHLGINALAGTGKTSTIVEGIKYLPRGKKALMLAFNKSIATELKERVQKSYVDISTMHSLGFKALKNINKDIIIDEKKCFNFVQSLVKDSKDFDLITSICKCISMCKNTLSHDSDAIEQIIQMFDFETFDLSNSEYIELVQKTLEYSKSNQTIIDFDDMIWLPIVCKYSLTKYDCVFVDECQDLNKCQTMMVLSSCRKDGKIIFVYDVNQTLYGFRGADPEVINKFVNVLKADILDLPVTYRCPKKIVYKAQEIVPTYTPSSNAIDGNIYNILEDDILNKIKPGDFLLSRTNAPLIKWCMALLKNKIPANIHGRDVGENLIWFVKKSKKKTIKALIPYIETWKQEQFDKFSGTKRDLSGYEDKAQCLLNLCEEAKDINDLLDIIKKLFKDVDEKNKVILSTVHRAKGLETDNVFMLKNTFRYYAGVTGVESFIFYVCITRAKKNLYIVRKENNYTKYDNKLDEINLDN